MGSIGVNSTTATDDACDGQRTSRSVSVVALALLLFVAFKCRLDQALFGSPEVIHENIGSGLEKRQSAGSTGSSSNGSSQGPFVKNKREPCNFCRIQIAVFPEMKFCVVYLIIVFVGLLICLILAVMLSAWCCKGALRFGELCSYFVTNVDDDIQAPSRTPCAALATSAHVAAVSVRLFYFI